MTEPLDWTTDMQTTGDPLRSVRRPRLALDPYFVAIDDGTSMAIDDMTQFARRGARLRVDRSLDR